jgi:hypothetical protein
MKEFSAKEIHPEVVHELGSDAIASAIVTKYTRNDAILQNEPEAEDRAEDQGFSIADNGILKGFEMMPFASIRRVARMTFIPLANVFCCLTKSLQFVLKRLRSVTHRLSDLQKQARVIKSKESLKLLHSMRCHSWKYVMTFDEAWFYISIDRESIWLSSEDKVPQKESHLRN